MTLPAPRIHISFETDTLDDRSDDGIERVNDSDMADTGDPTLIWTPANSAAVSKVSNGEGGQALHVEYGGVSTPRTTQSVLVSGDHYNMAVRARGDGVVNGDARSEGGSVDWYPTTSTTWQTAQWEHLGGTALLRAASLAAGAGQYTEYDYFSAKRMLKKYLDQSGNGFHCLKGNGYSGFTLPTALPGKGISIDNTNHYCKIPDPFRATPTFSVTFMMRFPAVNALQEILDAFDGGSVYFLFLQNATNVLQFYSGGTAGTNSANFTLPSNITNRNWLHVGGTYDGVDTKLYIDGIHVASAPAPVAPVFDNQNLWFGRFYNGTRSMLGQYFDMKFYDQGFLTDAQHQEAFQVNRRVLARLAA